MAITTQDIYARLGVEDADESTKAALVKNIVEITEQRFAEVAQQVLNDEQIEQLEKVTESDDFEVIAKWLGENVPQAESLYEAVMSDCIDGLRDKLDS